MPDASDRPLRVYRYRRDPWRQFVADAAAATAVSLAILVAKYVGGPFGLLTILVTMAAYWMVGYSFVLKNRSRRVIALYSDRIAWKDGLSGWRVEPLSEVGPPYGTRGLAVGGPGTEVVTSQGNLSFSYSLEGYADLNRRLEWASHGMSYSELPVEPAVWNGPVVFRYGSGLRNLALTKCLIGVGLAAVLYLAGWIAWMIPVLILFAWGAFDAMKFLNSRIEVLGNHLCWFDPWGRLQRRVRIGALQGLVSQGFSSSLRGRVESDDGDIPFGPDLERGEDLARAVYDVLAKRYAKALGSRESVGTGTS